MDPQKTASTSPVPTVGIVVLDGEKVLLVKHLPGAEHLDNTFGLPSGRLEEGESFEEAAVRELEEETGLSTAIEHLSPLRAEYIATIERKSGGSKTFLWKVFLCRKFSGSLRTTGDETLPRWVDRNTISSLLLLPNVENAISEAEKL